MEEGILDRLNGAYWRGREGQAGMSPVQLARAQLRASPNGCWPLALQTLRANYDANTARDAWVALLSEPNSGWSTYDPQSKTWTLYCVPGYQPMCGDAVESCPIAPGQQTTPQSQQPRYVQSQVMQQPKYAYASQPASPQTQSMQPRFAPQQSQMQPHAYYVPAGQVAPTGMTTGEKWILLFVVAGIIWFVWMTRPETEEEKRHYANRRALTR